MIATGLAPMCGDAVLLRVDPAAAGVPRSKVLRRADANFAGPDDPAALLVYEGDAEAVLDTDVVNGQAYFYKDYYWDADAGAYADDESAPVSVTPAATYQPLGPDVREVIRERFDRGLQQELSRGLLVVKLADGETGIDVKTAPPSIKNSHWPIVSVLLYVDQPSTRGVGETAIGGIGADPNESMLDDVSIGVDAWSQNIDERSRLHAALKRILQANLGIFTALGLTEVSWTIKDVNFIDGQFEAPVYCASLTLNCKAVSGVVAPNDGRVITDILVTAYSNFGGIIDQQGNT